MPAWLEMDRNVCPTIQKEVELLLLLFFFIIIIFIILFIIINVTVN